MKIKLSINLDYISNVKFNYYYLVLERFTDLSIYSFKSKIVSQVDKPLDSDRVNHLCYIENKNFFLLTGFDKLYSFDIINEKYNILLEEIMNPLIRFLESKNSLIYISNDLNLEKINLESKEIVYSKKIEYDSTYDPVDLSNDNKYLALEGDNGKTYSKIVNVYDVETGNLITTLSGYDIEDDNKYLEYQLGLENNIVYFLPYSREYYQEYFDDYFSKIGTDKQFFIEDVNFIKSIVFSQDSKEVLIYCKGDRMDHTKIFDTDTWELKERIYDYVKEDSIFMKDSNLIVSFDSYSKTTNIYSRLDKKIIKTIDKILHFSTDKTKYGKFIIENGENYFDIKDIDAIFSE